MHPLDLTGLLREPAPLVTRYAPSPTGYLHLGHVVNAIWVWGIARAIGARVMLRLEDHDRVRCRPEYEHALLEDLEWLGFLPDEGVTPLSRQSDRGPLYEHALSVLRTRGDVYTCRCSRRIIGSERYPGTCRTLGLRESTSLALRVRMDAGHEQFDDLVLGAQRQDPEAQSGDLLVRDRDGQWTYQFAVTVDDLEQCINLVIRGTDLLSSTGRQIRLARLLGRDAMPTFVHHPLILKPNGQKLSKAAGDSGVRELRLAGARPAQVIGRAAALAGLTDDETEVDAASVSRFWDRI